ncbi:hypothetical protein M747DRAFT_246123 [Aspergillus niger ATCC 13496]|uniref:Contig An09c0100, genomic contig n=3 Tax=Aspergillus niger TaxID=5061 RepID=A2QTX2_ASPNC|nr:uncharacterized protein An09g03570 [Aspergillus niger]RDH15932.1 hypothetical protein M747DRAFT_246123 [Aspergillus niger ATCC 13496]CAK96800.1 unnamed protein product [Aspergillus niger]
MSKTRTPMRNMRSQFEERRSQPWTSRRSEPQEREPTAQIRSRVASGEIDLEDVLHRLVSGSYPTMPHMDGLSHKLTEAMLAVPDDVQRTVWTHPHPDMITASHDANMFRKSPEDTDRVMIRTVAAYAVVSGLANSHRKGLRFTPPTRGRSYYEKSFVMAGLVPRTGRPGRVKLSCFRHQRVKQGRVKVFEYGHRSYKGINPRVPPIQSILKNLDLSADNPLKLAEREFVQLMPTSKSRGYADTSNGFYPKIISMAMLAQRIMGIMTHWREYMLMRGKLLRPSHIYTGEAEGGVLPGIRTDRASYVKVSLASAVAADVLTSAERGPYMNITSLGIMLVPSIGPLLGGLLSQQPG